MNVQLAALGCVLISALGQIAFKVAADAGTSAGTFFAPRPAAMVIASLGIYGVAAILWILLLQHVPISQVYPYLGLAFVIVPVAAHLLLGDAIGVRYLLGSVVIAAGVAITVSA